MSWSELRRGLVSRLVLLLKRETLSALPDNVFTRHLQAAHWDEWMMMMNKMVARKHKQRINKIKWARFLEKPIATNHAWRRLTSPLRDEGRKSDDGIWFNCVGAIIHFALLMWHFYLISCHATIKNEKRKEHVIKMDSSFCFLHFTLQCIGESCTAGSRRGQIWLASYH